VGTSTKQLKLLLQCCLPVTLTNGNSKWWEGTVGPRPIGHEYKVSCCKYRGSNDNGGKRDSLGLFSKIKGPFLRGTKKTEHRRTDGVIGSYAQQCRQLCGPQFTEKERKKKKALCKTDCEYTL